MHYKLWLLDLEKAGDKEELDTVVGDKSANIGSQVAEAELDRLVNISIIGSAQ